MKWTLGTLAVLAVAAGCGDSHLSNTAAIRAAVRASPRTYLHYGARSWGRQPHVRVRIRVNGSRATVLLAVTGTVTQRITLHQRGQNWSIASVADGVINGPHATRPATKVELAAISAVAERRYRRAIGCVTYAAEISTINRRYARVDYVYPRSQLLHPHGRCGLFVGNGVDIYAHAVSGWHYIGGGSSDWPCAWGPPGVIRSLVGACAPPR